MKLRRIAVVALAIFALSAAVAVAQTEVDHYRGHTEGKVLVRSGDDWKFRHGKISFDVSGNRVSNIRFEIRVACDESDRHFSYVVSHGGSLPLDKDGQFDGTASTNGNTGKDRIKGEVDGDHASGFVARSIRLNKSGKEQRPGELCASGRVEWSASS